MPAARQARRLGRELLVLRLGGKALVDLGVIDDLAEQFLAKWRQGALPQLSRGLAFPDEHLPARRLVAHHSQHVDALDLRSGA